MLFLASRYLQMLFSHNTSLFYFLKDFINLFLDREEGRERGTETSMCGCLLHAPHWGEPGVQPRHVP